MISKARRDAHHCHALGCKTKVPPEMLMCKKHWFMVPKALRDEVWRTYRPGQCEDMRPSRAWLRAANAAIKAVAMKEVVTVIRERTGLRRKRIRIRKAPRPDGDDWL